MHVGTMHVPPYGDAHAYVDSRQHADRPAVLAAIEGLIADLEGPHAAMVAPHAALRLRLLRTDIEAWSARDLVTGGS